ncbi:GNAT family N-acetyltransferase [Halostella sp. JP-L12]|uniref:GNAT family N-acetyltransferase n=1 Tax=Halostella TaxID=1843185 RepID=UPI000EF7D319|nr:MULTISPECIES: GNAT family N-acetyltransferase [Halostella]NHN48532.1 GNAT family N-acetyltransferase [Halostella sp. JP-L12]
MEFEVLGWPPDGPTLDLDHREFSYAGKFVMSNTGKAVVRDGGSVVAAAAFNEDRTDDSVLWIRYITARQDRRGDGIGPRLADFVADAAADRGYDRVRIAVNNPFAYRALYKARFGYTGETTGIAEVVLERPGDPSEERYRAGLDEFRGRESLSESERALLADASGPPDPVA